MELIAEGYLGGCVLVGKDRNLLFSPHFMPKV